MDAFEVRKAVSLSACGFDFAFGRLVKIEILANGGVMMTNGVENRIVDPQSSWRLRHQASERGK
jgi:hypothetical protein